MSVLTNKVGDQTSISTGTLATVIHPVIFVLTLHVLYCVYEIVLVIIIIYLFCLFQPSCSAHDSARGNNFCIF